MSAFDAKADSLQIRRVRFHGAADGLIARLRLEAALADVSPSALGLPPRALLIVRRVAPAARLNLGSPWRADKFGRAVQTDLERSARLAERPWLQPEAVGVDAVLFADESELMACLLRDWLRGWLGGRWWWPVVLHGLPIQEWWRRELLPRGDVLPAVLSRLAGQDEAAAWVLCLDEVETAQAEAAVLGAHGLPPWRNWPTFGTSPAKPQVSPQTSHSVVTPVHGDEDRTPALPVATADAFCEALGRLAGIVPEIRTSSLTFPQQRLLALTLGLQRASSWIRTAQFELALRALQETANMPSSRQPSATRPGGLGREEKSVMPREGTDAASTPGYFSPAANEAAPEMDLPAQHLSSPVSERSATAFSVAHASPDIGPPHPAPLERRSGEIGEIRIGKPRVLPMDASRAANADVPAVSVPPFPSAQEPLPEAYPVPIPANAMSQLREPETAGLEVIETAYGGIFYLLNVALALGLYGDFTQPMKPGIGLSPWDWLALLGRAWFGRNFEQDAVWLLLGKLAGRLPCGDVVERRNPPQESSPTRNLAGSWSPFGAENALKALPKAEGLDSKIFPLGGVPGNGFRPPNTWLVPADWLTPWGTVQALEVYLVRGRLQLWHGAGFVLLDTASTPDVDPLVQARALCAQVEHLAAARLVRVRGKPRGARHHNGRGALDRWLGCLLPYLEARLARAIGSDDPENVASRVCRHPAKVHCSPTAVDVHLSLAALPIELRIAGLDRDPGWIPAAGRMLAFHFA